MVIEIGKKMCLWELEKAMFLLQTATKELHMDVLSSKCILDVNESSGYTYLWCENYNFTLFMPITCELIKEDVFVLWTNSDTGEEKEELLTYFYNLRFIEHWVELNEKVKLMSAKYNSKN